MSLYFSILVLQRRDYEIYLKFICRFTIFNKHVWWHRYLQL